MPHSARKSPEPPIYTLRVRSLGAFLAPSNTRSVWRERAIAANQTLEELGNAVPPAFDLDGPTCGPSYSVVASARVRSS
jgi:hypothetical protein